MKSLALFLTFAFALLLSAPAFADVDLNTCGSGLAFWHLTTRIVSCVQDTVMSATSNMLMYISGFMRPITGGIFTIAVIATGIKFMSGEQNIPREGIVFLIKLALVSAFAFNLGGWGMVPFGVMQDGIRIASGGYIPWNQIDLMIGRIIGFDATGIDVSKGMIGILGASIFSSTMGLFVFLIGSFAIFMMLSFALRCVFSYLGALVLLGFIIIMAPFFVPLAILGYTFRYFDKWLTMLIAAMIHPALLFGFMKIFLSVLDGMTVYIMQNVMGGVNFEDIWRSNVPLFSWTMSTDPYLFQKMSGATQSQLGSPPTQTFMNPFGGGTMDMSIFKAFAVDFGADQVHMMHDLALGFIGLFLVAYTMASLINKIPDIADNIAGITTGLKFERMPFVDDIKQAIARIKSVGAGG